MKNNSIWKVQNDYQEVTCPHCNEKQYCRLTQIWAFDDTGTKALNYEVHNNYNPNLDELANLQVTYITLAGKQSPVTEVRTAGKWMLVADNEPIGEEM